MLGNQIVNTNMEDDNRADSDNVYKSEAKHKMIINWTPPDEKKFLLKRRFVSSRMFSKSVPRRNKNLFRYRMGGSLNLDTTNSKKSSWLKSLNSSFDSSSDNADKSSSRDLSRSAKIMKALSLNRSLIRHVNVDIKKSLNFDSSPSPKNESCSEESAQSDSINPLSPTFDKLLSYDTNSLESITSSVLVISSESIDENQNQTPQKTRKTAKLSDRTSDAKENLNHSSESSSSTSLLRSNLKERIDNILHIVQTPDLQSLKRGKSRTLGYVASTPRNLFQDFDEDEYDRPNTPENIMRLIPESMSAIKKSHKKEKLYRQENISTQQTNDSAIDEDLYMKSGTESSETDDVIASGSCNAASLKESQAKQKRIFKKTLTYDSDDELSDSRSISDHGASGNKTTSSEDDSSENKSTEAKDKIQDINISDKNFETSIHINKVHFMNDEERHYFDENDCDEELCLSLSRKDSPSACNVNVSDENVSISAASDPPVAQTSSRAVTPENHINIIQQIFTESIKKSHKKVKHETKKIFKPRSLHQKMESTQDSRNDDECESIINATCPLSSQARPNTPDDINSSRLLLLQFNSVKKSHKKEKCNKKTSTFAKCHKYQEYRKRNDTCKQNTRNKQPDINEISLKDSFESLESKDSLDVSPNKKQKSMNVSVQDETCSSAESSLGCKNIEDEFTMSPVKRSSLKLFSSTCASTNETSLEKSDSVQTMPRDLSRCVTPIAHCSRDEREDATSERYPLIDKSKTDACILHDGSANTADPKDKNGRLTPINLSTKELLCDMNSIKKSHKKTKHSRSIYNRREKRSSRYEDIKNVSFASSATTLEERQFGTLTETGMCSNTRDVREDKSYEETVYDNPRPSTSRIDDSIRNTTNLTKSNIMNVTPPNDFNSASFVTLFNTTSIKKFHKKERDFNAETKYILMSNEHDLSDDGSIFNEEDRLNTAENLDSCQGEDKMYT